MKSRNVTNKHRELTPIEAFSDGLEGALETAKMHHEKIKEDSYKSHRALLRGASETVMGLQGAYNVWALIKDDLEARAHEIGHNGTGEA